MDNPWYEHFFDDVYVDYLAERVDREETCNYLLSQFKIKPGALIFDQCCGTADISRAFAQKGFQVIGIDLSKQCIARACQLSESISASCYYKQADALTFIANPSVDAAFNWYTSFGYTDNDSINCQMIHNAYASLKEGGLYVLDYTNPAYILQNFKSTLKTQLEHRRGTIIKEVEIDMSRGMICSFWHYDTPKLGKITKYGESKLYFPSRLKELFLAAGFRDINLHGSIKGEPISKDSPRAIIIGKK